MKLAAMLGASIGMPAAARPPEKLRPQIGDELVYAYGDRSLEPILPADLDGRPPVVALPMDPTSGVVRDGSRLNQVMVVALPRDALTPATARHAAGGVVAYSAVCTHTGCAVENWDAGSQRLVCTCHGSEFEALDAARVAQGPAPKPLAMLPIEIAAERIVVRGPFSRRVGFQQSF